MCCDGHFDHVCRETRSQDVDIPHEQGQDQGPAKAENSNAASVGLAGGAQVLPWYSTVQAGHCSQTSRVCCMQFRALQIMYMLVCHCTCKSSVGTYASRGLDVHDVTAVASSSSAVALQHDGLQQEEADAVAALLAAASGLSSEDMNASTPYPSGLCLPHPCAKAPHLHFPTWEDTTNVSMAWANAVLTDGFAIGCVASVCNVCKLCTSSESLESLCCAFTFVLSCN